jgi:hypothetical protein
MRRFVLGLAVAAPLALGLAAAAAAAVRVQIAITPEAIPQCGTGHFLCAISNDGAEPVVARLCFSLRVGDAALCQPACGRLPLAAGESRSKESDFWLPPIVPPGVYELGVEATGSDGSSDRSTTTLTVTPAPHAECDYPGPALSGTEFLNGLLVAMGAEPLTPTPVTPSTWGSVKAVYR